MHLNTIILMIKYILLKFLLELDFVVALTCLLGNGDTHLHSVYHRLQSQTGSHYIGTFMLLFLINLTE